MGEACLGGDMASAEREPWPATRVWSGPLVDARKR